MNCKRCLVRAGQSRAAGGGTSGPMREQVVCPRLLDARNVAWQFLGLLLEVMGTSELLAE